MKLYQELGKGKLYRWIFMAYMQHSSIGYLGQMSPSTPPVLRSLQILSELLLVYREVNPAYSSLRDVAVWVRVCKEGIWSSCRLGLGLVYFFATLEGEYVDYIQNNTLLLWD